MKKTTKSLIIAIASVVVLVGAFLAVYYLVPDAEEDSETSSDSVSSEEADHYHLISLSTSDIKQIDVENEDGKYTLLAKAGDVESGSEVSLDSTDSNVYTLVGYEKLALIEDKPQMLAEDTTSVTATKIVNDGSNKSDFGFDNPRAVVTVTLNSGDKRTITLGDDAPDSKGAYIMVDGDEKIYLTDSDSIDGFLVSEMGMLSVDIGTSISDNSEEKFTKMIFSGTNFDNKEVVFDYNTSDAYTETYVITSPDKTVANEDTATYVISNVRYLAAERVAAVDPDEKALKEYGLDEPFITVNAEYSDLKVDYKASKPEDGLFYLLSNNIVYEMDETAVPWISYTYDDLIPSDILAPKYDSVDKITVDAGGKQYVFDLNRTSQTVRDDNEDTDIETFTLDVKCNGKSLDENIFSTFYNNLTSAKRSGLNDVDSSKKAVLTVTYEFSDGTSAKAEYFEGENRKCPVLINGSIGSTAFESYVTKITEDVANVANGESIKSIS